MFFLGRHNEPLVSGFFEATIYGPVHPDLYRYLRVFGADPVDEYFYQYREVTEQPAAGLVDEVVTALAHSGLGKLVAITQCSYGAWDKNYRPNFGSTDVSGILIPNEDILEEYRIREKRAEATEAA